MVRGNVHSLLRVISELVTALETSPLSTIKTLFTIIMIINLPYSLISQQISSTRHLQYTPIKPPTIYHGILLGFLSGVHVITYFSGFDV